MSEPLVFQQGYIRGVSQRHTSATAAVDGSYDFACLVSSWDKRCVSVTDAKGFTSKYGALLLFDGKDDLGLREKHDPLLRAFANTTCSQWKPITGDSADLESVWGKLNASLSEAVKEIGHPLNVFIDLCTCPRYFSLALLTRCLKDGLARRVTAFYAEGKYPDEKDESSRHELFTTGGWTQAAVPGLEGEWNPSRKLFYLVSVGFEGAKTLRFVSKIEPDRVSLLFPKPGFYEEYPARTLNQNQELIHLFSIPEQQIAYAHAGDAVAAWKALCDSRLERCDEENTSYVCCGTKPHSVALALRAMAVGYPAVIYIVPDKHNVVATEPSGVYWQYKFQDVSVPE